MMQSYRRARFHRVRVADADRYIPQFARSLFRSLARWVRVWCTHSVRFPRTRVSAANRKTQDGRSPRETQPTDGFLHHTSPSMRARAHTRGTN